MHVMSLQYKAMRGDSIEVPIYSDIQHIFFPVQRTPVLQPSKETHYKSPPLKVRARRSESKVKATMAPVASGSMPASESQPDPNLGSARSPLIS